MKILEFNTEDNFLKAKDLKMGYLYLVKDGRLVVYLGKDSIGRFGFYTIANCLYTMKNYPIATLSHYDIQVKHLVSMAKAVMSQCLNPKELDFYKGVPKLCCVFPYVEFSLKYADWYNKSQAVVKIPPLANPNEAPKPGFVGAKDLILGHCYYAGSCWRSTYCYLGRTSQGGYIWYFIGNEDNFVRASISELFSGSEVTKSNKKVKPLELALSDPDAFVSDECARLIHSGYRKDPTMIKAYLDRFGR